MATEPAWWRQALTELPEPGQPSRWVVGVSGGGDSVALLRFLTEAAALRPGFELIVAHFHHGTRGAESDADADFVEQLARNLGWPFAIGRWAPSRTSHFEEDARRARLEWLGELAQREKANAVAVGHNRDDQAETVLQRILRGTGLRGLAGIPSRRRLTEGVELVRPLLAATRSELRTYLETLGQSCREDASNQDTRWSRSRIRHQLLPMLAGAYNPDVAGALVRLAEQAKQNQEAQQGRIRRGARRVCQARSETTLTLDLSRFRGIAAHDRTEILRRLWKSQGWPERKMGARRWQRLASLTNPDTPWDGQVDVGARVILQRVGLEATLNRPSSPEAPRLNVESMATIPVEMPVLVSGNGLLNSTPIRTEVGCGEGRIVLEAFASKETWEDWAGKNNPGCEVLDAGSIVPPLEVRKARPGDRFEPLGLGGRSQALNDFFRGRGLSQLERAKVPLLCDAVGIVWVVGHRISDRVRVREPEQPAHDDRRPLRLRVRWEPI